jgi:hypothetical protein
MQKAKHKSGRKYITKIDRGLSVLAKRRIKDKGKTLSHSEVWGIL